MELKIAEFAPRNEIRVYTLEEKLKLTGVALTKEQFNKVKLKDIMDRLEKLKETHKAFR